MNLVIDQGNTVCKVAVCTPRGVDRSYVLQGLGVVEVERLLSMHPEITSAIYSSVAKVDGDLLQILGQRLRGSFVVVDKQTPIPISLEYDRSTLGTDRLAAVVGAVHLVGSSRELLVIDAGTAITYERVGVGGIYRGGNISLGLRLRAKALHAFTSRLPLVDPLGSSPTGMYGHCTSEALGLGILRGISHEIDGYIAELRREYPEAAVLFTGGDAPRLYPYLNNDVEVVRNLVLLGLNIILEYNKQHTKYE